MQFCLGLQMPCCRQNCYRVLFPSLSVGRMRAPHCVRECMQVQMVSAMSFHFVFVAYCLPPLLKVPLVFLWRNLGAKSNRSKILGNLSALTTVGSRQKPCRGWVQARGMISSSESWNMYRRYKHVLLPVVDFMSYE